MLDIFSGSNTTGAVAEAENRRWLSFERDRQYLAASSFRFMSDRSTKEEWLSTYQDILIDQPVTIRSTNRQLQLFKKLGK